MLDGQMNGSIAHTGGMGWYKGSTYCTCLHAETLLRICFHFENISKQAHRRALKRPRTTCSVTFDECEAIIHSSSPLTKTTGVVLWLVRMIQIKLKPDSIFLPSWYFLSLPLLLSSRLSPVLEPCSPAVVSRCLWLTSCSFLLIDDELIKTQVWQRVERARQHDNSITADPWRQPLDCVSWSLIPSYLTFKALSYLVQLLCINAFLVVLFYSSN